MDHQYDGILFMMAMDTEFLIREYLDFKLSEDQERRLRNSLSHCSGVENHEKKSDEYVSSTTALMALQFFMSELNIRMDGLLDDADEMEAPAVKQFLKTMADRFLEVWIEVHETNKYLDTIQKRGC